MPGQNPTFVQSGPRTYEVSGNVTGGQVLEADTATSPTNAGMPVAKTGTLNSVKCVGVAFRDAVSAANRAAFEDGSTSYPGAFHTTDISVPDETVVVYNDYWGPATYTAACAERQRIKMGASGAVAPWVDGTDDIKLAIGWCAQPGGVASAGVGLARILV